MPRPCIFCQISEEKLPASVVYQDDSFMVLMDAYPLAEGHTLVIPRRHVKHLSELDLIEQQRLFELGTKVRSALHNAGYGLKGANILLNDGKAANQTVPHIHLHIIPRKPYDFISSLPKLFLHITGLFGIQTSRAKLDSIAKRVAEEFCKLN